MKTQWAYFAVLTMGMFVSSCKKDCGCPQTEDKTLTTQPGPNDGQDCLVGSRATDNGLWASTNMNFNPDLCAARWTWDIENAGEGTIRTYFRFPAVSQIPQDATIKSAKLSLYGVSSGMAIIQGNSTYPGSGYNSYGANTSLLKRVIGNWDEATITWNNKPGTTDVNQVEIAATTSQWNHSVTDINVTQLIKDMVSNNQNYGFVLQIQTEQIYRSIIFGSSEISDATKRPKLVVEYQIKK